MLQIQQALAVIATILNVVSAIGGVAFPSVEPVIKQVQTVLTGLTSIVPPTSLQNDIQDLGTALSTLKATGVVPAGSQADVELTAALNVLGKFDVTVADYKSGQFAVIDSKFVYDGVPGKVYAVADDGPASQLIQTGTTDPTQV